MSRFWGDLVARSRGLASRWLLGSRLGAVEASHDLISLGGALAAHGYPLQASPDAASIDGAVAAVAADWLDTLARWAAARAVVLAALFEEETCRALRRLVRGAIAGAPSSSRLAATVPTPQLGPAALRKLAAQPSVGAIAGLLERWDSPYAAPLAEHRGRVRPDLFHLELDLERTFLKRARAGARRGDSPLRQHVELSIDQRNAWTALACSRHAGGDETSPDALFLEGGRRLDREAFRTAADGPPEACACVLGAAFGGLELATTLTDGDPTPARLGAAALNDRQRAQEEARRIDPSSTATTLAATLALACEHRSIRRTGWRLALALADRTEEPR